MRTSRATETSLTDEIKALKREFQEAEVQVQVQEKLLAQLKPQRKEMEERCLAEYGVAISALEDWADHEAEEISQELSQLKKDIRAAKGIGSSSERALD